MICILSLNEEKQKGKILALDMFLDIKQNITPI